MLWATRYWRVVAIRAQRSGDSAAAKIGAVGWREATSLALQGPPIATTGGAGTASWVSTSSIIWGSSWTRPSASGANPLEVSQMARTPVRKGAASRVMSTTPGEETASTTTSAPASATSMSEEG